MRCALTGRTPQSGNNVSFSKKRTKRQFHPNVQMHHLYVAELGRSIRVPLSAKALRTIEKHGGLEGALRRQGRSLQAFLREAR